MATSQDVRLECRLLFTPDDLTHYLYALFHCSKYKKNFHHIPMDLLKILEKTDYKLSLQNFWQLVNYGREIKSLYFIEKKTLEQNANYFPVFRNPIVTQIKVIHRGTKKATGVDVCINKMQFYKNVSEEGWAFCLDSYSPAQRWLENKTGKNVTTMDVAIFKKNISFSTEMSRLTKKINAITI